MSFFCLVDDFAYWNLIQWDLSAQQHFATPIYTGPCPYGHLPSAVPWISEDRQKWLWNTHRLSFMRYNLIWIKNFQKEKYWPTVIRLWNSQDVILGHRVLILYLCRVYVERSPLRIWSSFLYVWLQTSRQWKHEPGKNEELPLERFRNDLASERQRPCPYCSVTFVSENGVQDAPTPTRWQKNKTG